LPLAVAASVATVGAVEWEAPHARVSAELRRPAAVRARAPAGSLPLPDRAAPGRGPKRAGLGGRDGEPQSCVGGRWAGLPGAVGLGGAAPPGVRRRCAAWSARWGPTRPETLLPLLARLRLADPAGASQPPRSPPAVAGSQHRPDSVAPRPPRPGTARRRLPGPLARPPPSHDFPGQRARLSSPAPGCRRHGRSSHDLTRRAPDWRARREVQGLPSNCPHSLLHAGEVTAGRASFLTRV
jgi:hypothetical protein